MTPQQVRDAPAVGETEVGLELGQRLEGEPALGETRVRDAQPGLLDPLVTVDEQVEVDRPGPETVRGIADSPELSLNGKEPLEKAPRGKLRVDGAGGVQEARLILVADRIGLPEGRDGRDLDPRVGLEELESSPEIVLPIAQVGAETDVCARHPVNIARVSVATRWFRDDETAQAVGAVAVAALAFGVSFGVLARAAGMGSLAPVVMSATAFAGSAQFAAVSIAEGGGLAAAVAAAVMLNARYVAMGTAIGPLFEGPFGRRVLQAQFIVDEAWALASRGHGRFDLPLLLRVGAVLYACWVAGTAVGVLGAEFLGDPERLGLDAAFPALFLALLVPQVRTSRALAAAAAAALIALVALPLAPPGLPIVAASVACLLGLGRR